MPAKPLVLLRPRLTKPSLVRASGSRVPQDRKARATRSAALTAQTCPLICRRSSRRPMNSYASTPTRSVCLRRFVQVGWSTRRATTNRAGSYLSLRLKPRKNRCAKKWRGYSKSRPSLTRATSRRTTLQGPRRRPAMPSTTRARLARLNRSWRSCALAIRRALSFSILRKPTRRSRRPTHCCLPARPPKPTLSRRTASRIDCLIRSHKGREKPNVPQASTRLTTTSPIRSASFRTCKLWARSSRRNTKPV